MSLANLAAALIFRFQHTGDISDLSEALSFQQHAIWLTRSGHRNMPAMLSSLGTLFRLRFERMGDLSDISEALSAHQRAVQLALDGHQHMPLCLNNLGISFECRFERIGDLSDLSEAISAHQRAVQLTPSGHPDMPTMLNDLGNSLHSRFKRMGDLLDLSEALSAQQRSIQHAPDGHPYMPKWLNNLGNLLEHRFERLGDPMDLSKSISVHQRAVQLTPDGHPDLPILLQNLGNSFLPRFKRLGDLSDLSEAISAQQRAVQLYPEGHPHLPACLNDIGVSFGRRFELMGDLSDLSKAISAQQRAVQFTPHGHPHMPALLINLGTSFLSQFQHTKDSADSDTAVHLFRESANTSGSPSIRLTAARLWAQLSTIRNDPATMEAHATVIELISQIAGMNRTIEQRQTDLVDISSLTTAAASAAFAHYEVEKALEWLEQGRCLVWSQLNQLRTPVDDLRAHDPHLAQRFLDISSALESSGSRRGLGTLSIHAPMSKKITLQDEAHVHVKLAGKWDKLLQEIRNIPQFRNFLRPPRASELLRRIPPDGPIILINVDKSRCDALALISGCNEPIHIPLTEFTYERATNLSRRLRNFLSQNGVRVREENRAIRPAPDPRVKGDIHFVLGVLWLEVVKPILEGLGYTVGLSLSLV